MSNTTFTLEQITRREVIREMILLDPEVLPVLKTAALYTDGCSRWHMYSELKARADILVGWHAHTPELATSKHYDALLWAIDMLLPETAMSEEAEEDESDEVA